MRKNTLYILMGLAIVALILAGCVTKKAVNQKPTVSLVVTPTEGIVNTTVFKATIEVDDPDKDSLTVKLDWGDGTETWDITWEGVAPPTTLEATHMYSTPDSFTVKVFVDDGKGGTSEDEVVVTVSPPPVEKHPPVIEDFEVKTPIYTSDSKVTFTATVSDADGDSVKLTFKIDGKKVWGDEYYREATSVTKEINLSEPLSRGVHTFTLEIVDDEGQVGTPVTKEATVERGKPVVSLKLNSEDIAGKTVYINKDAALSVEVYDEDHPFDVKVSSGTTILATDSTEAKDESNPWTYDATVTTPASTEISILFSVIATDATTNGVTEIEATVVVDTKEPTVTVNIASPCVTSGTFTAADTYLESFELTLEIDEIGSFTLKCGTESTTSEWSYTENVDYKLATITIVAYDKAGNKAETSDSTILDNVAPSFDVDDLTMDSTKENYNFKFGDGDPNATITSITADGSINIISTDTVNDITKNSTLVVELISGDYYYNTTLVGTITMWATDSCDNEASKTVSVYLDESLFPESYLGEIRLEDTTAPYNDYLWITFNNKNVEEGTPQVEIYQGGTLKGIVTEFDKNESPTGNIVTYKATLTGFDVTADVVYTVKIIKGSFKLGDTDYTFYNGLYEEDITATELMAPRP
ncbi:MAG: hypothetical protein DRP89_09225 [Candidatus Neomarinimicrobiota bacterium]|nr:MAG: hypothetical protein DRP89_09225 [Candidatus Neomarinimicrobiota bacterium]